MCTVTTDPVVCANYMSVVVAYTKQKHNPGPVPPLSLDPGFNAKCWKPFNQRVRSTRTDRCLCVLFSAGVCHRKPLLVLAQHGDSVMAFFIYVVVRGPESKSGAT